MQINYIQHKIIIKETKRKLHIIGEKLIHIDKSSPHSVQGEGCVACGMTPYCMTCFPDCTAVQTPGTAKVLPPSPFLFHVLGKQAWGRKIMISSCVFTPWVWICLKKTSRCSHIEGKTGDCVPSSNHGESGGCLHSALILRCPLCNCYI